jgi:glycosyltransferase involved in cell wall biosynthesis
MGEVENVYFMGPRDYKILKNYASLCDILTIPFLLNDITKSTSPVKIFEYMALQKPIVTTNLNECHKYKSVLIAKSHNEFLKKLEEVEHKKDSKEYLQLLDKEAKDNYWSKKAKIIIELIKKDE